MGGGCSTARAPLALALALDLEHIREHRAHLIASGAGLVRDGTQNLGDGLYRILSGLFCFSHWKKGKKQPHRKTKKAGREGRPLFVNSFTGDLHPCRWRASVVHSAEQYIVSLCPALMHSLHWNFAIASSAQCLKANQQDKTKEHKANTPRASAFGNQTPFFYPHRPAPPREFVRSLK